MSRSCVAPHSHVHFRMSSERFFFCPQYEHVLLVGQNRSTISNSRPYHSALYSSIVRNSRQPCSLMQRESLRFLTMFFTAKSSSAIVWFSRMSLVDNLWRKSFRVSAICWLKRATLMRAFSRFLEPFCLRECNR